MRTQSRSWLVGLLVAGFGLARGAGCRNEEAGVAGGASAPGAAAPLTLAIVTNNASDFWHVAAAGIHKYERESQVHVDVKMPEHGTTEEQNQLLEGLSSQGYDSIAVSAIDPAEQMLLLDRVATRSHLVTIDSDAPRSKRLLYIGTNNYEAGKVLGGQIARLLPNGGKLAVFVGRLSAENAAQRLQGIVDATANKHIAIVDEREDNGDRARARTNVEDAFHAHPDLNLVVGLWSYNGPAIAAAIESLGKKGQLLAAAFDEEEGTLKGIADGVIAVSVVQKPFEFGYLSSRWLHQLALRGEAAKQDIPASRRIETGVDVISMSNIAAFREQLAALKH